MMSVNFRSRQEGVSRFLSAVCSTILVGACVLVAHASDTAAPAQQSQPDASAAKTVWAGVYTQAQAKRGEDIYADHCSECHGEDLSGDTPYNPSPQLAGKAFMLRWDNRSVNELFKFISNNMPKTDPGSLSKDNYIDVIAFILRSNKLPAGGQELTQDKEVLQKITFAKDKPSGGPSVATK